MYTNCLFGQDLLILHGDLCPYFLSLSYFGFSYLEMVSSTNILQYINVLHTANLLQQFIVAISIEATSFIFMKVLWYMYIQNPAIEDVESVCPYLCPSTLRCNVITQKSFQPRYFILQKTDDDERKTPIDFGVQRSIVILTYSATLCCNVITQTVLSLQTWYFIHRWKTVKGRHL